MAKSSEPAATEPSEPRRSFLSPLPKIGFLNPILMRGFFSICVLVAFSLCYFSFPIAKWRLNCPECDQTLIHASFRRFDGGGGFEKKTDISHILFGIGGSAETWSSRRHYCELWWKPGITRGYVWLDEPPEKGESSASWPETSPPYRISENTSRFKYTNWYGSKSAVRIARIVKESFELGLDNVRWFVMGDDDTVFFTENLVSVLNKYDHREMYYIGSVSESVEQALVHSYTMGYGGAGFAISYPLAKELVRILDTCIDRYANFYGSDQKVGACVTEIGVPLTKEAGFHQMDIRGSPTGLLSAHPLSPLVSLHHLDYVHSLYPGLNRVESIRRLIQAYKLDPARILQQSICYDQTRNWSISISWGFNVMVFPYLVTARDLSTPLQTFLTWGTWSPQPFTFNTRPLGLDPCERPVVFYFDGVKVVGDRNATTSYTSVDPLHRTHCQHNNYAALYAIKGFNVTTAILDPEILTRRQGRRRQCAEIINGLDRPNGAKALELRIRACRPMESLTTP